MPPAADPRTEAAAPPATPPPAPMFSPVGIVVVFLLLVIEGVVVFMVARYLGQSKGAEVSSDKKYREVDLGTIARELPVGDEATRLTETFSIQPVLVLNTQFDDMDQVKAEVELKKNLLKSRVNEIVLQKPKKYFYEQGVLDDLGRTLKHELNLLLKSKDGHEPIEKVIFPQARLPVQQ
ncbi:MAG: hypothetical protein HYY17_09185 [Planctomycetes bacterium]|nr:hypothetical protein [Planctomycetota bacterium]